MKDELVDAENAVAALTVARGIIAYDNLLKRRAAQLTENKNWIAELERRLSASRDDFVAIGAQLNALKREFHPELIVNGCETGCCSTGAGVCAMCANPYPCPTRLEFDKILQPMGTEAEAPDD